MHWLEMLNEIGDQANGRLQKLRTEAHELEAIFSASHGTAKRRLVAAKPSNSSVT